MGVILEKNYNQLSLGRLPKTSSSGLLRIAFCLPELTPLQQVMRGEPGDAAYIQQKYIATGLNDRGHHLTFVTRDDSGRTVYTSNLQQPEFAPQTWSATPWFTIASKGTWRVQQWLGVPYLNVFSNYRFFDTCLRCLPGHDVVHERNGLYNNGVAMSCQRLGLPYVMFFDADQIMELDFMGKPITGLLRWRAKQLLRYNLKVARAIICVSEAAKINLVTTWNVPAEKIVVFPNGVDIQRFRPNPKARAEVRASLRLNTHPVIMFVGGFYEWHDVATLIDAFAQVLRTQSDARLVLVGDGPQYQAMMQRVAAAGLEHAVLFTGIVPHSEVPRLIAAADIAVAPVTLMQHNLWLSPMKLFEYMATETAVVASTVGQLAEVIQDGQNGLLVPSGDVSAMGRALLRLLGDPHLRFRLGQQAREDAVQKHSWDHYVARLERVYAAVITGQPVNLL